MIKNIQKYLLIHYPTIWNIKLIPVLLVLLLAHLAFFGIGYASANVTFGDYYYSPVNDLGLVYFASVLVGILILIGWLIFYNRNNAFRTFYPRKSHHIYLEWILIFVVTTAIAFLPVTLTEGSITRWRTIASYNEATEAMELLNKVKILIPSDKDNYLYDSDYQNPITIANGALSRIDTLNLDLYSFDYNKEGNIVVKGYTGPSLLFYRNYYYDYDYYDYNQEEKKLRKKYTDQIESVKQWLKDGDKEKIHSLMSEYMSLQQKHNLEGTIKTDDWFKRIYNPPYFPVNNNTVIGSSNNSYYYDYEISSSIEHPYLQYDELRSGYSQVIESYDNNEVIRYMSLVCLSIATWVSIFIFSFRATTGKAWLISFVCSGVLIFISCLLGVAISEASSSYNSGQSFIIFLSLFWIILFIIMLVNIITKIYDKKYKGHSSIFFNIFIWLMPCISPFLYFGYYAVIDDRGYKDDNAIEIVFWINILIVIIAMWFTTILIRKWKSIPEE